MYNDNDNDIRVTLKHNAASGDDLHAEDKMRDDQDTHWFAVADKTNQNAYTIHSVRDSQLVWTRQINWFANSDEGDATRKIIVKNYVEGDVNQLWGRSTELHWWGYDKDGMTYDQNTMSYKEFNLDISYCGANKNKAYMREDNGTKQQIWHLEYITTVKESHNIVELLGWYIPQGDIKHSLDCNSIDTARALAKRWITDKHYAGAWDSSVKKYYVKEIPENLTSYDAKDDMLAPVKNADMVMHFVGIQFHTEISKDSLTPLVSRLRLALDADPTDEQIQTITDFIWEILGKRHGDELPVTEAKVLLRRLLNALGRPADDVLLDSVLAQLDKDNNGQIDFDRFKTYVTVFLSNRSVQAE